MKLQGHEKVNGITVKVPEHDVVLHSLNMNMSINKYIQLSEGMSDFLLSDRTNLTLIKRWRNFNFYEVHFKNKIYGTIILIN